MTTPDNSYWTKRLSDAHQDRMNPIRRRGIRLPGNVEFAGTEHVSVRLPPAAPGRNMQEDEAAFEGWLLALKAWCGIPSASLVWAPQTEDSPHYQRFLYRVHHFGRLFPWFRAETRPEVGARALAGGRLLVNVPGATSAAAATKPGSEADLEFRLRDTGQLRCALGLDAMDRQYPVGLFEGRVSEESRVFPGGKSAIDLYGWNEAERRLALVELKKDEKHGVGIISELFFYTMFLRDLREGRFQLDGPGGKRALLDPHMVMRAERLDAWMLAPGYHPLLDGGGPVALLNDACAVAGDPCHFGRIRLGIDEGEFSFEFLDGERAGL